MAEKSQTEIEPRQRGASEYLEKTLDMEHPRIYLHASGEKRKHENEVPVQKGMGETQSDNGHTKRWLVQPSRKANKNPFHRMGRILSQICEVAYHRGVD